MRVAGSGPAETAGPGQRSPGGAGERLGRALVDLGRVRVRSAQILACWEGCVPELRGEASQHRLLAEALESLAGEGTIVLPKKGSWDRSFRPPLPNFVTVPAARAGVPAAAWRRFPWRAELGWVASMAALNARQFEALVALNDWLGAGGANASVVPGRIRSAEVFGHEKALDDLAASALWRPGRLSWALLRAERLAPPIVVRRVGPGPELLVVENADPFWLCAEVLAGAGGPIGRVAWGSGNAFCSTAPALAAEPERPERLWYWGDADPEGVRIPAAGAAQVGAVGLPPLRPHAGLWLAYRGCAVHEAGMHRWDGVALGWLGSAGEAVDGAARLGGRVAQEAVGRDRLAAALAAGGHQAG